MTSEHNADLFQMSDASGEGTVAEMRIRVEDVAAGDGPAGDAAGEIGARLKAARQSRGMDMQACGRALRLPVRVLERLEAGDFGKPEDHVFTRGALQSYARLLGVPGFAVEAALRVAVPQQQPALVPTGTALRGNWLQRYGAAGTYIVLTAFVAVPLVWLGLRGGLDNQLTRIAPLDRAPAASAPARVHPTKAPAETGQELPLMASMTPFSAMSLDSAPATGDKAAVSDAAAHAGPQAGDHVLSLSAHGDTWMEVADANGKTLASGMLHAGDTRSYHSSSALNVTLGNADAVDVESDGKPLSLDAYRHANVARFQVFASGESNG